MTLKEKFSLILMQFWASDWEGQCEQVADEFAIGFADWVNGEAEYLDYNEKGTVYLYKHNRYRTSELLQIYKKEKDL